MTDAGSRGCCGARWGLVCSPSAGRVFGGCWVEVGPVVARRWGLLFGRWVRLWLRGVGGMFERGGCGGKERYSWMFCWSCEALGAFADRDGAPAGALLLVAVSFGGSGECVRLAGDGLGVGVCRGGCGPLYIGLGVGLVLRPSDE